ncbi:MAG: dihydroneopterin aldolase [Bacillota bacterium]
MAKGDLLLAKGMQFWGTHGHNPEENVYGQKFVVDVEASYDMDKICRSDNIEDGFSYATLYEITRKVITGEQHKLLQKLAQRVADEINAAYPLDFVKVTVKKPFVSIGGVIDYTGVTIVRKGTAAG